MTRKDFELIAGAIRDISTKDQKAGQIAGEVFANKLQGTNPSFNKQRFLKACNL